MKNTELRNWMMLRDGEQLEKRLVWMGAGETPKEPIASKEATKEQIDAENPKEKLDALADRIKDLTLKNALVDIDPKGPVSAAKLRGALNKEVAEIAKDLNIKNIDLYLMNGLLENIGKADKLPSKLNAGELTDLTKWMQDKKIAKFTIDHGFWKFFDKDKNPIQAEYKLDDKGEKIADDKDSKDKSKKTVKPTSDKAVLSADVGKKRAADAAETAADVERLQPGKLEKATSKGEPIELLEKDTMTGVLGSLEYSLQDDKGKPAIKSEEMKVTLVKYIKEVPGKNPEEQFTNFVKKVRDAGFNQISVLEGKIVFMKDKKEPTSNPLNLQVKGEPQLLYAHDSLRDQAEKKAREKKAEGEKKLVEAENDKKDKPTKYDATEKAVQEILKQPGAKELPPVDPRYLPAFEAILNYKDTPVNVNLPLNDFGLKCTFFRNEQGTYVLKYGDGPKANMMYQPTVGAKDPFGEAKKWFAEHINNGEMLQKIQSFNIRSAANFNILNYKIPIDNGPKEVGNGKVEYELGWKTGVLEKDPHIFVEALLHGGIRVLVQKSDISPGEKGDNKDKYEFVAGGFHDMLRSLTALQAVYDNPDKGKVDAKGENQVQNTEAERRFFAKGATGLNEEIAKSGVDGTGKILSVDSVGTTIEAKLLDGYYLHFDWMAKLDPAQKIQMRKEGDQFVVIMVPDGRPLGKTDSVTKGGFTEMLRMVASQRTELATQGGEKMVLQKVNALLTDYNKQIGGGTDALTPVTGVKITGTAGSGDGPQIVYMSLAPGVEPVGFDFKIYTVGEKKVAPGIEKAIQQGYLLKAPAELVKAASPEKAGDAAKKAPDQAGDVGKKGPDKPAEGSTISVERNPDKIPTIMKEAQLKIDEIVKGIKGEDKQAEIKNYLKVYFAGHDDISKINGLAEVAMINLTKVDRGFLEKQFKDNGKKRMDYLIKVINDPKAKVDAAKDKTTPEPWETDLSVKYSKYPKALNVILANMKILQASARLPESKGDIGGKSFLDDYRFKLEKVIDDRLSILTVEKGSTPLSIDKGLSEYLGKNIKNARFESMPEWTKAVADAAEKAKAETDSKAEAKANFDKQKAGPHGIPFSQFENGAVAGLGPDAIKAFKATGALKPEDIFLSNLKENTPISDKTMSFNVKVGPADKQQPYTINFIKQGATTVMKIAPGWNNLNNIANLSTTNDKQADPVGYLLIKVGAWKGPSGSALN